MRDCYRGWPIYQTLQGNYWSPAFGHRDVAATLATLERWIDMAIVSGEIKEGLAQR